MPMVVTVLEALVAPERTADLLSAYTDAARGPYPAGLVRSALLHSRAEPKQWRLETVWASGDALAAMRREPGKPRGVVIFEAAGAQPTLAIFELAEEFSVAARP